MGTTIIPSVAPRRALAGPRALLVALAMLAVPFAGPAVAQDTTGQQQQPAQDPQHPATDPNSRLGQKFGDWQELCQKASETQEICGVIQEVHGEGGKLALWAAVGYFQPDTGPVMILRVPYDLTDPPTGLRVSQGAEVQVDGSGNVKVPIEICAPGGCQIGLLMEDAFVKALKAGNKMNLTIPLATGQTATINLSLKGFTAAYDSLKKPK